MMVDRVANGNSYGIQGNYNLGGDLYNVNGSEVEDFKDRMIAFADAADEIFSAVVTVKQAALATGVLGGTIGEAAPIVGPAKTDNSNPDGSKSCKHGEMKWLDYTKANGDAVKGWYCQAKYSGRGSQCPPVKV